MKTRMANKWFLPAIVAASLAYFANATSAEVPASAGVSLVGVPASSAVSLAGVSASAAALTSGLAVPAAAGTSSARQACVTPPPVPAPTSAFSGGQPVEAYQSVYHSFWEFIKDNYYGPAKLDNWSSMEHAFDDKLANPNDLHIALKELAKATGDKWTSYTAPGDIREFRQRQVDGIIGAGVELYNNDGQRYQVDVITYRSPAWGTALRERDFVRCVNGIEIASLPKENVDALVRGTKGSKVTLTAISAEGGSEYTVDLTIASAPKAAVEAVRLPTGEIYIRMPSFDGPAYNAEFVKVFSDVYNGQPFAGIVLDLRNNRGGEMPEAIKFASLFLPDNAVVTKSLWKDAKGFHKEDKLVIPAADLKFDGKPVDPDVLAVLRASKLAVLVNGSTASAGEVVFGGLKDNKRGTSYGVTTFGKGTGWIGMEGPARGTITISGLRFQTPDGNEVHKVGIAPAVEVALPRATTANSGSAVPAFSSDPQFDAALEYLRK